MIELLNKLDKDTLIALCIALFEIHQPHNAKGIIKSILWDMRNEKRNRNDQHS
jgi:hypothetical protein